MVFSKGKKFISTKIIRNNPPVRRLALTLAPRSLLVSDHVSPVEVCLDDDGTAQIIGGNMYSGEFPGLGAMTKPFASSRAIYICPSLCV